MSDHFIDALASLLIPLIFIIAVIVCITMPPI